MEKELKPTNNAEPSETLTDEEQDFEFAFSIESDPLSFPDTAADNIFHNGQILPSYPLFNRDLIIQYNNRSSSSSIASDANHLHRLSTSAPQTFAPPSPDRCRKSSSTGSTRKWKLRDLVVGRSRSDGKDKFVSIPLPEKKEKKGLKSFNSLAKSASVEVEKKEKSTKEMDIVTAHRIYYGKSDAPAAHRRSFLPYRQELLGGIFGNGKQHHPFSN